MELDPDRLRTAARRWDALADDVADAAARLRAAPVPGPAAAAVEAARLLEAADAALAGVVADADRLVEGLLVTVRAAVDADDAVAGSLRHLDP